MKYFIAIVDKEADSAYGLWFPDAPGCFSAADNEHDIMKNAVDALKLHFDDQDVPKPRAIEAVANDPDVLEARRGGAYMLAVPLVTQKRAAVRVNVSLDKGTVAAIDKAADLRGLTRSAFIAEAALNEIEGR